MEFCRFFSMTTVRRFTACDLFKFNSINLDPLTETYSISCYLNYLAQWPDYFQLAESSRMMSYIMGKAEGEQELWHGHVTALTVSPEYRRMGLAKRMMKGLEEVSEKIYDTYFVDLFVRVSNSVAIKMYASIDCRYEQFGYTVYRRVIDYYTGPSEEDAFDMRKALPRDIEKKSVIPLRHPVTTDQLEWS